MGYLSMFSCLKSYEIPWVILFGLSGAVPKERVLCSTCVTSISPVKISSEMDYDRSNCCKAPIFRQPKHDHSRFWVWRKIPSPVWMSPSVLISLNSVLIKQSLNGTRVTSISHFSFNSTNLYFIVDLPGWLINLCQIVKIFAEK